MTDGLIAALARAQQKMDHPKKTKTNPHFKSTYADLADVVNAVRPALNAQGIAVVQLVEGGDLVTQLRLGEELIESRIPLNLDAKPQELGSQMTYVRRFALAAITGVASEDDDDGNAASAAKPRQQARTQAPVSADGELLATTEQAKQFKAICDATGRNSKDRAALVLERTGTTAWDEVTKTAADALIAALKAEGSGWETVRRGDGGWEAHPAGSDAPFMDSADDLAVDNAAVAADVDAALSGPALARSAAKGAKP